MNVTLDLLSHTSALDPQTVLDPVSQAVLGTLASLGQQLLDAVFPRHLDQLSLPALRVYGIVPFSRRGMLVEAEGVRALLLEGCLGGLFGKDGGGRVSSEEPLQRCR